MKKFVLTFLAVIVAVVAAWGAAGHHDYYLALRKPGSSLIELSDPINVLSSGSAIAPVSIGKQVRMPCNFEAVLKVTGAPTGGSPSLTVWFQHSSDNGYTWQDFACTKATSTGTYYVPISTISGGWLPVNLVTFETGDFSQCASQTNAAIVTTPVLDGTYAVQLNRNASVASVEIRKQGTTYYNLPTAFYRFLFEYTSNPADGGMVNFQDTASNLKAAMHLTAGNNLTFYDSAGMLQSTGTTVLSSGKVYVIDAKIGTGTSAPWEVRINGVVEMSGNANLSTVNNGSIKLGGNATYTDTYYYDDVAIDARSYPGLYPVSDGSLANNMAVQGSIGDKLRIKFSSVAGTSGFWSFQPFVFPCFQGR